MTASSGVQCYQLPSQQLPDQKLRSTCICQHVGAPAKVSSLATRQHDQAATCSEPRSDAVVRSLGLQHTTWTVSRALQQGPAVMTEEALAKTSLHLSVTCACVQGFVTCPHLVVPTTVHTAATITCNRAEACVRWCQTLAHECTRRYGG